jgi:AcrR family transcriptional regulator
VPTRRTVTISRPAREAGASASASDPGAGTVNDKATAARARIIATARAHFLRFGFARCPMDVLAAEMRMSKKTLYAHYPTKDALVAAVLEAKLAEVRSDVLGVLETPGLDFAGRAHRVVSHMVAQMGEVSPVFLRDLEQTMPSLFSHVQSVRRQILPQVWGRMLADGAAGGHVRAGVEAPLVSELVLIAVEGLLQPAVLDRLRLSPGEVIQRVLSIAFTGVLTPAGRKAYEALPTS